MPREEDRDTRFASRFENLKDSTCDLRAILDLLHDSDLPVIHDQGQSRWLTNIVQRLRNI
jgi:hypothetical protein